METITANGVDIAYVASGSGTPLVLLHGGEGSHAMFDPFRPLLGEGIRTIAYDQRDTGASHNPPEPYEMADLARDCAALIRGLGYDKAHIFGLSYGGAIALQLAITVPEVVDTLTLGATLPRGTATTVTRVLGLPPQDRRQQMLGMLLSDQGQRSEQLMAETTAALIHRPPDADTRRINAIRAYDVTDQLSKITAPTLLIYGQDDPLAPPAVAHQLADAIPGSRLELLPGLRHGVTLEGKHTSARLLREFILSRPD